MQPPQTIRAGLVVICFLITATSCLAQANTQVIYTGKLLGYFRSPSQQKRDNAQGCSANSPNSEAANKFKALREKKPSAVLVGTGDNFAPQLEARVFNDFPKPDLSGVQSGYYTPGNKELYYWSKEDDQWIYFTEIDKKPILKARIELGRETIPTDNVGCFLAGARFAAVVPGKHDFYFGPERVRELARFMATLTSTDMKGYGFNKDYHPPQMLGANLVIKTSQVDPPSPLKSDPKSKWPDETSVKNLGDGKSVYPWFSSIVHVQLPSPSSSLIWKLVRDQFRQHQHARRDQFETFLVDRIEKSAGADKQEWIKFDESIRQLKDVWICPPPSPKPELPCDGGWQIGGASLSTTVPAPESETLRRQIKDWFIKNNDFDRNDFQKFLAQNVPKPHEKDKDEWQKLSDGFAPLAAKSINVCPTNEFNEVAADCKQGWPVQEAGFAQDDSGITYSFRILPLPTKDWPTDKSIPILEPGWNYGLCQLVKDLPKDVIQPKCQTFSVFSPFFSFSRVAPAQGADYKDPDPFVFIRPDEDPKHEVAIFGVVNPNITQRIGVLNYSWLNNEKKLKTVVSAENPAEALKEQLDYFDLWYETANDQRKFAGLKILLAQMSPQEAKLLAARLKAFQVVVTEADSEQATSEASVTTKWTSDTPGSSFIAVPAPYYEPGLKEDTEGFVHFGMLTAHSIERNESVEWQLRSVVSDSVKVDAHLMAPDALAKIIAPSLKGCIEAEFLGDLKDEKNLDSLVKSRSNPSDLIKWATLCAMRERLGADVALIQKRDFFNRVPEDANPPNVQQILDRLVWKGDLLTLVYVPGSALKKALELSKKYDADDSDPLSLSDERFRGLDVLGIKKSDKGEYLVNESPLDEKKTYAVATTDYIGAGDTGYPDLAASALNPKTQARQFPDKLELISAVVCRKVRPDDQSAKCIDELRHDDYLDKIADAPPFPRKAGFFTRVWDRFPFKGPENTPWTRSPGDVLDKRVQQRPTWLLSLKNFSVQFSGLKNNDTDASTDQKFSGISTSGVNTDSNHSIIVGLDTRLLLRSTHKYDLFAAAGIDYNEKSTGVANTTPNVVQNANRLTGDLGLLWNLSGRGPIRWGPVFTLHGETQLARPFTMFKLATSTTDANGNVIQDRLTIHQDRSRLLLARAGLRSQNRTNEFEVGFEGGRETNVLKEYQFFTDGVLTETCGARANITFAKCIKDGSNHNPPTITKNSVSQAILETRPRVGLYWKWNISIPFSEKVKYELTDEGDLFFADIATDLSTDTRFRDLSKQSLKFNIFPSFSIGPSLQLLLYRNQASLDDQGKPIKNSFLSQKTFGFEASFSFDWFNRREAGAQIKHKPQ